MKTLKINDEIMIFDCTYKINRHDMFLIIDIDVISLNIFFYSNMCFMKNETIANYELLFRIYNDLFKNIDIFLSII